MRMDLARKAKQFNGAAPKLRQPQNMWIEIFLVHAFFNPLAFHETSRKSSIT